MVSNTLTCTKCFDVHLLTHLYVYEFHCMQAKTSWWGTQTDPQVHISPLGHVWNSTGHIRRRWSFLV